MATRRKKDPSIALQGAVWMTVGGENLGGQSRVGLLRAIAEHGSITQAAKAIGMSYKGAWDAVDAMNNLAGAPLASAPPAGAAAARRASRRAAWSWSSASHASTRRTAASCSCSARRQST